MNSRRYLDSDMPSFWTPEGRYGESPEERKRNHPKRTYPLGAVTRETDSHGREVVVELNAPLGELPKCWRWDDVQHTWLELTHPHRRAEIAQELDETNHPFGAAIDDTQHGWNDYLWRCSRAANDIGTKAETISSADEAEALIRRLRKGIQALGINQRQTTHMVRSQADHAGYHARKGELGIARWMIKTAAANLSHAAIVSQI